MWSSARLSIQLPMRWGVCSSGCKLVTWIGCRLDILEMERICIDSTVGSDCTGAGSSRVFSPRRSGRPSGRGTLMNSSMSPTAGM